MECPRCGGALGKRSLGKAKVHGCAACDGVWLDTPQANAVLARVAALPIVVAAEKIAREAASPIGPTRNVARCPIDAEPMMRRQEDGVDIDTCVLHGTWFDAGEIRRIANANMVSGGAWEKSTRRGAPASTGERAAEPADFVEAFFDALDIADDNR